MERDRIETNKTLNHKLAAVPDFKWKLTRANSGDCNSLASSTGNSSAHNKKSMHVNHATRLPGGFAFAALAAFVAALILPAIHEPAYFDSQLGEIKEHTIHGFACAAGLCFSAWFFASHFFYLFANITFVMLTPLLIRQCTGLDLVRSLLMLIATIAPIHMIAFQHQRTKIGVYFWLLAFVLSSVGHWLRFLLTTSSFSTAVPPKSPIAAG